MHRGHIRAQRTFAHLFPVAGEVPPRFITMQPVAAAPTSQVFHEGELAVQKRAGTYESSQEVGEIIQPALSPDAAQFWSTRQFVLLCAAGPSADDDRHASDDSTSSNPMIATTLLTGPRGFVRVEHRYVPGEEVQVCRVSTNEEHVHVGAQPGDTC